MTASKRTPWSDRVDECRQQFTTERNEAIRRELLGYVDETPVMDVGCGSGEFRKHVEGTGGEFIGVDLTPEFEPDVCADATDLPMPDNDVPTVVLKNVLQHLFSWPAAVAECCRVASDRVIAVERTHDRCTEIVATEPCLRRRFHPDTLEAEFGYHGSATVHECEVDDRLSIVVGEV